MSYTDLREFVAASVLESLENIESLHGRDVLAGYALCVDDDLSSLFQMGASTRLWDRSDPETRFVPPDWDLEESAGEFDEACVLLRQLYEEAESHREHVRLAFAALVDALCSARREGRFAQDVTLLVSSVDPGELTRELEEKAVLELNDEATRAAFVVVMR